MENSEIIFTIEKEKTLAKNFKELSDAFINLIDQVSLSVCDGKHLLEHYVSVEKGSLVLKSSLAPKLPEDYEYSKKARMAIIDGIKNINGSEGKELPKYFNEAALSALYKISRANEANIIINNNTINLNDDLANNVIPLFPAKYSAYSSIEGIVKAIALKSDGLRLSIEDVLRGKYVKCSFENSELEEQAKYLIGKKVYAYGCITFDANDIAKSICVEKLEEFKNDNLPTWQEMRGVLGE